MTFHDARAVVALCTEHAEETLHLEFKVLKDDSGSVILKDDRRVLGKALSGFANAEGGVLVIGVETDRPDGVDRAAKPQLARDARRLRDRLLAWLPDALAPPLPGLTAHAVLGDDASGFVVIEVPRSDARPHMSTAHHQYFRRGSAGTIVMEHGEIRDLFLAERNARLALTSRVHRGRKVDPHGYEAQVIFGIRNEGHVAARNPYLRLKVSLVAFQSAPGLREHGHGNAKWPRPDGSIMFDSSESQILHAGDIIEIARAEVVLWPVVPARYAPNPRSPVLSYDDMRSPENWRWTGPSRSGPGSVPLGDFMVLANYGAENAVTQSEELAVTLDHLLRTLSLPNTELDAIFGQAGWPPHS